VKITYIENDGTEHTVEAKSGWSVMENAVKNAVPGILGECGGSATCGTCRIYVGEEWLARMQEPHADELAVLEFVEESQPGARLSCQIKMTELLDGLVVRMPEKQYA
jgi:2Fe-2S ferredoxin